MSVVLLILKIIGILLLAVLGLAVFLLLSVLLCPVYYRIRGWSDPELTVYARLRWLYPLVVLGIRLEGGKANLQLRILGIPLLPRKEKTPRKKRRRERRRREGQLQASKAGCPPEAEEPRPKTEEQAAPPKLPQTPDSKKLSEIRKILLKIKTFFEKVKSLPRMIKEKVAKLKEMVFQIWQELGDEANHRILRMLLGELKALLGHYLPRRLKADVTFGMGDPALTGQALGVLALFPIFLKPGVRIVPDFMAEKTYVTGSFDLAGRVRAVHVIAAALRLWRNGDVKKLIQRVRNRR